MRGIQNLNTVACSSLCEYKVFRYVVSFKTRQQTLLAVRIAELNAKIKEIVAKEQVLRDEIDKIIAEIEGEELQ